MTQSLRTGAGSAGRNRPARPALLTAIACLELAAAAWDGRIFLKFNALYPVHWGSGWSLISEFLPAVMSIVAIYAALALLQGRRSGWNTWMVRHLVLCSFYLLSLPVLQMQSLFNPGLSLVITWRLMVILFSVAAGTYLYAIRGRFDR